MATRNGNLLQTLKQCVPEFDPINGPVKQIQQCTNLAKAWKDWLKNLEDCLEVEINANRQWGRCQCDQPVIMKKKLGL